MVVVALVQRFLGTELKASMFILELRGLLQLLGNCTMSWIQVVVLVFHYLGLLHEWGPLSPVDLLNGKSSCFFRSIEDGGSSPDTTYEFHCKYGGLLEPSPT